MKRLINALKQQWMLGIILLLSAVSAFAAPKQITLHYEVSRNGSLFANVKETFTQDGQHYQIKSVTEGVGLYALMGKRTLLSKGMVTAAGLKPEHFEVQRKRKSKNLINDFDWKNNVLNMQVKGKHKEAKLEKGAQDLLSVMYQFMFQAPNQETLALPITTGKRFSMKNYQVSQAKTLKTKAGAFEVVSLMNKGKKTKTIYLAKDKQYLPVKLVLDDDGEVLEQTITKVSIE